MNIIFVRDVFIKNTPHVNCEIQLVKALNKLGHDAKLIGIGDKTDIGKELILLRSPFGKRKYFLLILLFYLPYYCVNKKINAVILDQHIIPATIFLLILKGIFRIKIILDVRSIPVETGLPWDYKASCKFANHFFDGATFITEGTKEYVEKLIKTKFKKTALFPSAVNITIFHPAITDSIPLYVKEKAKKRINIFYHGSISPNRGLDLVIDAVNKIKEKYSNLLLISISDNNQYILDYCDSKNYDLANYMLLLDVVQHEKLTGYINLADICVVPLPRMLWWEISSPLKLMEYLAMEKPIVLSDIKAHLEVVPLNSEFAVYFNPDNRNDLSDKLLETITNLANLKSNAAEGRKIASSRFTWEIQAKVIEEFINEI